MGSGVKNWAFGLKGKTLGGRYLLGDVIGVGGMGAVFQAVHKRVGRAVAVKLLVPDLSEDRETGLRFSQEARAAAQSARKGVVEILDFDEDEDYGPYLVMELLRGESLSKRIKRRGKLDVIEALSIALQVVDALGSVHANAIIHRDLKPANVFLAISEDGDEVVKLLDFGISRIAASTKATQLTKPGVLLGTPRYMSPEQAWCKPDVDHRTDLYALGAILYHAISGVKPYQELPPGKLLEAVLKRPPKPLYEVAQGLSASVLELVESAMERERDVRFQSADEMRDSIQKALEEMARNAMLQGAEGSEDSEAFVGVSLADLGATIAMEPPSMKSPGAGGAPAVAMTPPAVNTPPPSKDSQSPTSAGTPISKVLPAMRAEGVNPHQIKPPVSTAAPVVRTAPPQNPSDNLGQTVPGYLAPQSGVAGAPKPGATPASSGANSMAGRGSMSDLSEDGRTKPGYTELASSTGKDSTPAGAVHVGGASSAPQENLAKTTLLNNSSASVPAVAIPAAPMTPPVAAQPTSSPMPGTPAGGMPAVGAPAVGVAEVGHGSEPSFPAMQPAQAASGSFDVVPQNEPPKRSVLKVALFVLFALLFLVAAAVGGLWISLEGDFSRLTGGYAEPTDNPGPTAEPQVPVAEPDASVSQVPTPTKVIEPVVTPVPQLPEAGAVIPEQPAANESKLAQWRSEIQIARNEREVGQAQRSRERLMAVVDEIEQLRPARDSEDARIGVDACLLLGDIELASVGTGAADSTNYVDRLSTQTQNVTRHYQRAWRLGVTEMEQCVFGGMARAAERAADACQRAAQTPGIGDVEVARRRTEGQRYLTSARGHYQRALSVRESVCRAQVESGLARVGAGSAPAAPAPASASASDPK